jgi:hypothetical protein
MKIYKPNNSIIMKIKKIITFLGILSLVFVLNASYVLAARVGGHGGMFDFNYSPYAHKYNQRVINHNAQDLFIPTRTIQERESFLHASASGAEVVPDRCGWNARDKHNIASPQWDNRLLPFRHITRGYRHHHFVLGRGWVDEAPIDMAVYYDTNGDQYVCGYNITNQHWLGISKCTLGDAGAYESSHHC